MSTSPVCLGQPPLPPKKFSLQSLLNRSSDSKNTHSKLLRRYSLRKKHPDRFSCTYQSFSKDLYEGGAVNFQNSVQNNGNRFNGTFPYSDFSDSTASLSRASRPNSVNSILTLSRSHSEGNLSSVSDDVDILRTNNTTEEDDHFYTFDHHNATAPPDVGVNTSFTKYFRALSGSWKNLLNRKSQYAFLD